MNTPTPESSPRSSRTSRPDVVPAAAVLPSALSLVDSLSDVVAAQRRHLGLSLRQLGEASGVNFSWLSRIENGQARVMPSVDAIIGLASSLQLSVAELLIRSGIDPSVVLPTEARARELRSSPTRVTVAEVTR